MKRTKVWLGLFLIFFSGLAIGVAGSSFLMKEHLKGFARGGPGRMNRFFITKVTRDLDLTEKQRDKIHQIIEQDRDRVRSLSSAFGDSMKTITERQLDQIKVHLDPAQREQVDENVKRFHERLDHLKRERPGKDRRRRDKRPHREHRDSLPKKKNEPGED